MMIKWRIQDAAIRKFEPILILLIGIAFPGCSFWSGFRPWNGIAKDSQATLPPGVVLPRERLKAWQESAKKAGTAEERMALAAQLRTEFAGEQDPFMRREILRLAAKLDVTTATEIAQSAVNDPEESVRWEACKLLGKVGGAESVAILAEVARRETSSDVRQAAIKALGSIKNANAVPVLAEFLDERDPATQYLAMQSLREVTGKDFGNDVRRWQAYVRGENTADQPAVSLAGRKEDAIF
ncbi:MAG: HEAT repeat domain-containing protein [Thermogutta sp.]